MVQGNEIYNDLNRSRRKLENVVADLSSKINSLEKRSGMLLNREASLWQDFARMHIKEKIDLPQQVMHVLDDRKLRIEEEQGNVASCQSKLDDLEARRNVELGNLSETQSRLQTQRETCDSAFEAHEDAVTLVKQKHAHETTLKGLEEKYGRAVQELMDKGPAYRDDPYYNYLLKRGYGTSDYSGWGVTVPLDRWLARVIDFEKKTRDHEALTRVPQWIQDRQDKIAEKNLQVTADLKKISDVIYEDVLALEAEVDELHQTVAVTEEEIEFVTAQMHEASNFLAESAHAADEEMERAIQKFVKILSSKGLPNLFDKAKRTSSKVDDKIVEELISVIARRENIQEEIAVHRPGLKEMERRSDEISQVIAKLKSRRWTSYDSRFSGSDMDGLAEELSEGRISSEAAWSKLTWAHREPRRSRSGSSGTLIGTSSSGSSYGSSGSSESGGFSSGGGIGGSSWSSGGGFGGGDSSSGGGF